MSHSRFDPLDPTPPFMYDPCPTGDNEKNGCFGCIGSIISQSVILILCIICVLLTGCGSTKETSFIEKHRIETMMERMDSVINTRHVVHQDSTWRELVLHQFQSIREKSDTSHTVIVDTANFFSYSSKEILDVNLTVHYFRNY